MRRRTVLLVAILVAIQETIVAQPQPSKQPKLPVDAGPIDPDAPKTFTSTPSGLQYRVLRKGKGETPKATSTVKVHYHGWLDNEEPFDSSFGGEPATFPLNRVIPGWTEGLQFVAGPAKPEANPPAATPESEPERGGLIELVIPAKLAYGDRGVPGAIPPGATLHFLVELIEVK